MQNLIDALIPEIEYLMPQQHFRALSVGVIDFKSNQWKALEYLNGSYQSPHCFFDLASLTKPLTLAFSVLKHPEIWNKKQLAWLLNHRASMPIGGRLSKQNWREDISRFIPVISDIDVYSDYSALRLQLEIEKLYNSALYDHCSPMWHSEVVSWLDMNSEQKRLAQPTGYRQGHQIIGEVHDDNAFYLAEKLSHAGLFGSIQGVCETLLKCNTEYQLLSRMERAFDDGEAEDRRFVRGWDTISDQQKTLAGEGASHMTFGHLGFTGTSIWVDVKKLTGHVILSNATENYWYDKTGLNQIRRRLGEIIWSHGLN